MFGKRWGLGYRIQEMSEIPDNDKPRDEAARAAEIEAAVSAGSFYVDTARRYSVPLAGARILELGPGPHFGTALILASHGASVVVADRFLPHWNADYHPAIYEGIRRKYPGPTSALSRAIEHGHDHELTTLAEPAETLPSCQCEFDLIFSNAVLEHVADLDSVIERCAAVTKSGAINSHQIDFRDHDSFDRPLEFLLEADDDFAMKFERRLGECGNRRRPLEASRCFRNCGFSLEVVYPTERASPEYLADFLPRLRAAPSRYADWPSEDLEVTSALYVARRT